MYWVKVVRGKCDYLSTRSAARAYGLECPAVPLRRLESSTTRGLNFSAGRDKVRVDLANDLVNLMYELCLQGLKKGTNFDIENPRSSLL